VRRLDRKAAALVVLVILVTVSLAYVYETEDTRHTTDAYLLWTAYLVLFAVILILLLPRLNAALNTITERIPPHI